MTAFDLTGHTAVVTGAATGIGKAVAIRLAGAGARIAVADRDLPRAEAVAAELPTVAAGPHFAVAVDVADGPSVLAAAKVVLERAGRIEILVNNAGIAGVIAPLWEQPEDDWDRVIAVNLKGTFHWCRAVIQQMRERKYGRIVNVASVAGKEGNPNMTSYPASKPAVIRLHQVIRQGSGARRHLRQRCFARGGSDRDTEPSDSRAGGVHDSKNPDRAHR